MHKSYVGKSDMYGFKIALVDNGEPEEFLLFQQNYKMMLGASGTLTSGATKQYIHTLLHRKALYDFENLCVQIGNTTTMHLNQILLDLGM